ncbi:MAG: 16S rRNA (adenine(1518)-N(6)/adenine(1519)-N(6))-dimethyltransferase RsmA [Verrucomicrobiota bacterium]
MTRTEIRQALESRGLQPLKQLGQNFLHDANLCAWLAASVLEDQPAGAEVLELGPGLGALTRPLLARGAAVHAIEVDRGLSRFLRETLAAEPRFALTEGDALAEIARREALPAVVAGNLPYNISTPLLMELLDHPTPPARMQFLLQREVGERLGSPANTKSYGALSVILQAEYRVEILRLFPPQVFYPEPEVASAAVRLTRRAKPAVTLAERAAFRRFVKQGFSQRRKKLRNLLPVEDDRRAGALDVAAWVELFRSARGG